MTPAQAEAVLFDLPRFADRGASAYAPGLDRVRALLRAMGDPHIGLPAVHVAGTNGKGSTASFVAAIGTASGRRVGLHTSPHLLSLRERMRVDGEPAPPEWLATAVERHEAAFREIGPSFFEATVALSLLYFREREVDLAVVEVGLGGRLDATNVVEPVACLVTHIGMDHTDLLGDTLGAIAREKAGIAKPGVPFLHALGPGDARDALEDEVRQRGAEPERVRETVALAEAVGGLRFMTTRGTVGPVALGLPGEHQRWNAALAVRAAEIAWPEASAVPVGLREVVARAGLRGRGERWSGDPRIVLDVAHNADGWAAALQNLHPVGTLWVLAGMMADKDATALASLLASTSARLFTIDLPGDRALPATAFVRMVAEHGGAAEVAPSAADALRQFRREAGPDDLLLVTGSHVTVAEALAALRHGGAD